eukprot:gnl/TRDRNA2_/TRDRNA2_173084_c0_seq3.p1 gnl/TRDRNA2_/TRDRNA2_173084_c0~~gnl/TRDRNA2_/TRDRNA2_173084_c0_seq3.p1  ORF type:complete len:190 (-),score=29.65 gnl/TRDRNA2_/TRDRNA2_173084_c0_seq3:93-662(-)
MSVEQGGGHTDGIFFTQHVGKLKPVELSCVYVAVVALAELLSTGVISPSTRDRLQYASMAARLITMGWHCSTHFWCANLSMYITWKMTQSWALTVEAYLFPSFPPSHDDQSLQATAPRAIEPYVPKPPDKPAGPGKRPSRCFGSKSSTDVAEAKPEIEASLSSRSSEVARAAGFTTLADFLEGSGRCAV